jgi:hypothetical protein
MQPLENGKRGYVRRSRRRHCLHRRQNQKKFFAQRVALYIWGMIPLLTVLQARDTFRVSRSDK